MIQEIEGNSPGTWHSKHAAVLCWMYSELARLFRGQLLVLSCDQCSPKEKKVLKYLFIHSIVNYTMLQNCWNICVFSYPLTFFSWLSLTLWESSPPPLNLLLGLWYDTREYELRESIPHIELCTYHEPRSSIFKRSGIGQIVKTVKTQKSKLLETVGEEVHFTFLDEDDDFVLEKCDKHK